jgi:hypothetical protein
MPDLDAAASDEGQMLRPELRLDLGAEPGDLVQPLGLHRRRRRDPERHAMQHY